MQSYSSKIYGKTVRSYNYNLLQVHLKMHPKMTTRILQFLPAKSRQTSIVLFARQCLPTKQIGLFQINAGSSKLFHDHFQ